MELDEMKLAWQAFDEKLQQQQALNLQLFRESRLDKAQRALQPLVRGQAAQMALGVLAIALSVLYWHEHAHPPHALAGCLMIASFGVLLIGSAFYILSLIHRIDYAGPILDIQRRLADLQRWRVRVEGPLNVLLGCFIWIPVLWMNLAWYGLDLWSPGFVRWAVATALVGVAASLLVIGLMWRFGCAGRLRDGAVGRSLLRADAALAEIERFRQE